MLEQVGVAAIERHTVGLADRLNRGLRAQDARVLTPLGNRSSIVSFAVEPARDAAALFAKAGVDVSVRDGGRMVRVSPALFNTDDDIDRFLDVPRHCCGADGAGPWAGRAAHRAGIADRRQSCAASSTS